MSETKEAKAGGYNPKPWRLIRSCTEGQNPYRYFVQDLHGNVIAALPDTTSKTERELICSAPALLAERDELRNALIKCYLELRAMHSHYHSDCPGGCPFEDATNQAREALALSGGGK